MAFMKPQSLQPLPRYYYSPTYRGAATDVSGEPIESLYKTRKMEGTLGGVFNVLLAGERASGTVLYGARKKLGFGEIDWIEHAEQGAYKRVSPSEALGIKGYDDKFWTARGITSLALDVLLDPTTYIGVGLVGKTAKLGGMATKGFAKGGIRVGGEGVEFLARAQARGLSKHAAQRQLVEYMSVSTTVHASMMARTGPRAVKFMGHPVMATARVTEPVGKLWRAAPMLERRSSMLGHLQEAFVPFHKLSQQLGTTAKEPYKEFYRATGVGRTGWDRHVQRMAHGVSEEYGMPIARYIERGELPASNVDEIMRLAKQHQAEYHRMYKEKISAGLLKDEQFISGYMAHVPTEEAMTYAASKMPKLAGRRRESTAALYLLSLKSAKERLITEDVFSANVYMQGKTGIEKWFETDPFVALQKYGAEHVMGIQSHDLWGRITRMGFKAVAKTKPKYTGSQIDKMVAERVSDYQTRHPIYGKQLVARKAFESEEEEFVRRMTRSTWMRPIGMKTDVAWSPYERLLSITKESSPVGTLKKYIESEKRGPVQGANIEQPKQYVADIERASIEYTRLSADPVARSEWAKLNRANLRAMSLAPGAPETLEAYTKTHVREMLHEITKLPSAKAVAETRVSGKAVLRNAEKMFGYETDFLARTSPLSMFDEMVGRSPRAYTNSEIGKVSASIRAELSAATKKSSLPATVEQGGILYQLEKGYYVPTEAFAEYTRRIPTTGWGSRLETKFKKTLTSIWPAFHARNLYGMVAWQNVLAGAGFKGYKTNVDVLRKTSPWMQKHTPWAVGDVGKMFDVPFMGKKTAAEMRVIAEEAEIYGITGMVDVAASYSVNRAGIMNKLNRVWEDIPQEAMLGVESVGRGALFWDRIMKGVPIESAMKDVEKFHFHYGSGALTSFESDYMRHGFLFYRWMRGNIPLQAQMSIEKPYMFAGLGKLYARGSSPDERERLQGWQKEQFGATIGGTFAALGIPFYEHPALMLNPSNWEDLYFAMTPAIKFPVGILAGRDPATGAPIKDWGDRSRYAASQFMGRGVYAQRELAKTLSGERPVSWTAMHQLGGIGVYELSDAPMYTGMTTMSRMPSGIRAMGPNPRELDRIPDVTWMDSNINRCVARRNSPATWREVFCVRNPMQPVASMFVSVDSSARTWWSVYTREHCVGMQFMWWHIQTRYCTNDACITDWVTSSVEYMTSFADRDKIFGVIDEYMGAASLVE